MPANDSGISLVQTNKKAQFIHLRTKRALFRGTTSFRRTLPTRRTHHPDSPAHFTGINQGLAVTGSPLPIYSPYYRDFFGSQSERRSTLGCCGGFQPAAHLLYQCIKRLLFPEEIRSFQLLEHIVLISRQDVNWHTRICAMA
jgi:hypothetical protein